MGHRSVQGYSVNQTETSSGDSATRNRLFAAASVILGLAIAFTLAEWGLGQYFQRVQSQSMDPGFMRYHAQLGWSLSPGWTGQHRHYDYQATYNVGPDGFRLQSESLSTGADVPRIAVLGDSYTFGLGVEDDETFTAILNSRGEGQYLNYGVPGTSTDQHLLLLDALLSGRPPDRVLLVIYLPNDILDNTLEYPLQADQAKPRYLLENGELELSNVPVPRLAKPARLRSTTMGSLVLEGIQTGNGLLSGTQLGRMVETIIGSRPYEMAELRPALERNLEPALNLFSALLGRMEVISSRRRIPLTIALLPGRDAMVNPQGISYHYQEYLRQEILAMAETESIAAIDLMTELAALEGSDLEELFFPHDGHLTPTGHRFVAETIARQLEE